MADEMMKPTKMWALVNFDIIRCVHHLRHSCIEDGVSAVGSKEEYRRWIRRGAFKVIPVTVAPIKPRRGRKKP